MQSKATEKINIQIMENELSASDWELYWWVSFFQIAFFKAEPVPIPTLTFEKTRVNTFGHHRIGRNDCAFREQINLNRLYLTRPLFEVLATLLHEMVHCWEFFYLPEERRTKSWYHVKAFRDKMAEFGILCNTNGGHVGLDYKGKFVQTLKQHAVAFNGFEGYISSDSTVVPIDPKPTQKGSSKLKKWSCGCTNIRVAVKDAEIQCLKCKNQFVEV